MEQYKIDFINFMVECGALKFGDFLLKSGRRSPFFMNAGAFVTGGELSLLGEFYARAIKANFGLDFDVVFGPAYKGIPLCVSTAIALKKLFNKEVKYCSNRKEIKDHGDGGILLGSALHSGDKVLIIEDVTTSGKSIEETFPILKSQGDVKILGEIVLLDRMERALDSEKSALFVISEKYGFPARAIVTMKEVIEALYNRHGEGGIKCIANKNPEDTNGGNAAKKNATVETGTAGNAAQKNAPIITKEIKLALDEYYKKWGAK